MDAAEIPAVVLAAGEGRRLAPVTNTRPKPMLPIANVPILEHVLDALLDAGVESVIFVVGYQQERIRNHFGDGVDWGIDIRYVEQQPQLGTGHAIAQVEPVVNGPFLVLNGDRIVEPAIISTVREALGNGAPVLSATSVRYPSTLGVVSETDGLLESIEEKPLDPAHKELVNAGVYGFDQGIFDAIEATELHGGELMITETLQALAGETNVPVVRYTGEWLDITHLWDLPLVNGEVVSSLRLGRGHPDQRTSSDVRVAETATVVDSATVASGTSIGDRARVSSGAVLENVVVFPEAVIEPGAVVRDAVIGANATIGANTTIGGGFSTVVVDETAYVDVEFGAAIGDNARVGAGSVVHPGALVGDAVRTDPGVQLSGAIESGAIVRRG